MNRRFQWLIATALILLTGNAAFLNVRMEKRITKDRILLSNIEGLAAQSWGNDQYLMEIIKKNIDILGKMAVRYKELDSQIDKVDQLAFKRLIQARITLRKAIADKILEYENAVPNLVDKINPSVVMIEIPRRSYNRYTGEEEIFWGGGTGVVYDANHVLTVAHISKYLEDPDNTLPNPRIRTYDGRTWNIIDVASCDEFDYDLYGSPDVGMLKVDGLDDYPPINLGMTSDLRYGQSVVVIGHPNMERYSVSFGVLSRIGVFKNKPTEFLLQIDARINGGNSGGPVVGLDGLCYGLCSFGGKSRPGDDGLNYFIGAHTLKKYIPELLDELDD